MGGHLGEGKMLGRLKERFYWPGCSDAVREWCRACRNCATRKSTAPRRRANLQTLRAGHPMQIVCVDIMGPLPETEKGNKYVLVAADCFTKWVEVYGIPNQEAVTVAVKLVDEMFCRFSPPEQVHSDQGRQFESELVKQIGNLLQIKKTHTTPYRPKGNGMVERFNRTLQDMLAIAVGKHPADWEVYIRKLCFAYNTSVHSSTGNSPFFLMFGRQATIPIDLMFPLDKEQQKEVPEYVHQLREGLQAAYSLVRERCNTEHKRQKSIYDRKAHGGPFNKGDHVWLFSPAVPPGRCKTFHHLWKGPFIVMDKLRDTTYKIKPIHNGGRWQFVHFDRLKPCTRTMEEVDLHSPEKGAGERLQETLTTPPTVHAPAAEGNDSRSIGFDDILVSDDEDGAHVAGEQEPDEAIENQRRYPARNRRIPERYGPYVEH